MKKSLPLAKPVITSYPQHAELLSIIQNVDISYQWIYDNFVQLYIDRGQPHRTYFANNLPIQDCPCIRYQLISRCIINSVKTNFVDFIKDCINRNIYIIVNLNNRYISATDHYNKRDFVHATLISGYCDENATVEISDFYGSYKTIYESYDNIEASFQNFHHALRGVNPEMDFYDKRYLWQDDVILIELNNEYDYYESYVNLKHELTDYINGSNTFLRTNSCECRCFNQKDFVFGINVYNALIDYLSKDKSELINPDMSMFYAIFDRQQLMINRLEYFREHGVFNIDESIIDRFKILSDLMKKAISIEGKFMVRPDKKILEKLIRILEESKEMDVSACCELLAVMN